jgi:hypothetical protein
VIDRIDRRTVGAVLERVHGLLVLLYPEEAARRWGLGMALTLAHYGSIPSGVPARLPALGA